MPINLQGSGNIAEGWGAPPHLDAPNISGLVSAILGNRLGQQKLTQESVADTIKQMQEQRSSEAFIRAAQQAGVIPQGDYSGMDARSAAALASAIAAQTPDTQRDALLKAQTALLNRTPARGSGVNLQREERIRADEEFKRQQAQSKILGTQAEDIANQQEDYGLKPDVTPATHGYVMRDGKLDYARTPEEQASPQLVSPSDPLNPKTADAPTFTPDVYKQRQEASALRQKILAQQKDVQAKILTPPVDTGGGGGGGGPHDDAITKANQIKEDLKLGRINPDEARAQIKALNIPGLQ